MKILSQFLIVDRSDHRNNVFHPSHCIQRLSEKKPKDISDMSRNISVKWIKTYGRWNIENADRTVANYGAAARAKCVGDGRTSRLTRHVGTATRAGSWASTARAWVGLIPKTHWGLTPAFDTYRAHWTAYNYN